MRAGHTAERACDLIDRVYRANMSVTAIVKKLIEDEKGGASCIKNCGCLV